MIIAYIITFVVLGFVLGYFLEEGAAYGWIIVITIGWAFVMGPWAVATFIELAIGYAIASQAKR